LGKNAGLIGWEVLNNKDGSLYVIRQSTDDRAQCFESACGSSNNDNVVSRHKFLFFLVTESSLMLSMFFEIFSTTKADV
jgi:acylphosphatase